MGDGKWKNMIGKLNEAEEKAVLEFKEELMKKFGDNIKMIRLFGSKARGGFHGESDIDLLVVVSRGDWRTRREIIDVSTDLLYKYDVFISPRVTDEKHYLNLVRLQTGFIKNIQKEGISL